MPARPLRVIENNARQPRASVCAPWRAEAARLFAAVCSTKWRGRPVGAARVVATHRGIVALTQNGAAWLCSKYMR